MIFLGLYLTGRWETAIIKIENIGSVLWRRIEPLAKKFIPIRSISHALIAGILWGWLTCGLVYSALFLAMSANSISQGALIMWSFGIGTLPVLLGLGTSRLTSLLTYKNNGYVPQQAQLLFALEYFNSRSFFSPDIKSIQN